jgi:chromosome partitioning protein
VTTKVVAFFNNKGGVGKTSLVYHLAWMYSKLGLRIVAADLDPQANLTAAFLDENQLEQLWPEGAHPRTLFGTVLPIIEGTGDLAETYPVDIPEGPSIIVGDLALSEFEDELSAMWPNSLDGSARAFRVLSAFWRVVQGAADTRAANLVLLDLGPNLGAINRSALLAADYVVVPLSPDLFSLQGLRNLGPTLIKWRKQWQDRLPKSPPGLPLPAGRMEPVGYIVQQHSVRLDRPVRAYERWITRIPATYHDKVLASPTPDLRVEDDSECLGLLKHYRSLMPMAQESRKPMFDLRPADGAIGAHMQAVRDADLAFRNLALRLAERLGVTLPAPT